MNSTNPVSDITNINHVGMAVRDHAVTATQFEAMGFQLTPYSPHSAAWKPGEPVRSLASGNRCVMFGDTYLEILASENPQQPAERIANFLARHQGGHIICFDCSDCNVVDDRLRAAGVETSGVIPLQRDIDTPDGMRTARFERVQFAPKDTPEGYIQAARHLTPDYIYQPRYTAHPNGCTQLSETILITQHLEEMVARYTVYLGSTPQHEDGVARFTLAAGTTLTIVDADRAATILPGTLWPPLPGIAAVAFRTPNLAEQRERLDRAGFTVGKVDGRLLVPAEEISGIAVMFAP